MYNARFFDGKHIQPAEAFVEIVPEGLKINYENNNIKYEIYWPNSSLQLMERLYKNKPALIGSKSMLGARLVIDKPEIYQTLLPLIPPQNIKLSHVHHPWRKAWLLAAAVVLLVIMPIWHFHTIALWVANIMPYSLEQKFWKNVVEPEFGNYVECTGPKGRAALNKVVDKLGKAANIKHKIDVRVINAPTTVNAESAPGFHIFIYSGLLNMDNPDAVTAVIAHELGHSVYHHVVAKYISVLGMSAFFKAVLGLSANNVAFDFINLKYSRDYETQADIFAIDLLKAAEINPFGFQYAMEYLEKMSGEFQGIEPYLVDHPTHHERIDLITKNKNIPTLPPSLTQQEWKDLKGICSETKPMKF